MKKSVYILFSVLVFFTGCVVTQTTDLGQPWIIVNSSEIKPGVSTADDVIKTMGLPYKIIQGRGTDTEMYLYLNIRKRQKTFLIPPILPVYTKSRLSERKSIVVIMLVKRKVTMVLTPTEDELKEGVPELKEEGSGIMDLLKQ